MFLKAVFLSGIQTNLRNFSLSLTNITFDKVRGVIGLILSNATRSIEQVTITYFVLANPHPRFVFDSFTYPGSIPSADYGIIGNSGFNLGFSGPRYYGLIMESILLNCLGSCRNSCLNKN